MDKWTMFKNYMHNELGVTKDDIRAWIKEAVHEEAITLVNQQVGKFSVQDQINSIVNKLINDNYRFRNDLTNAIAKRIMINVTCNKTDTTKDDPMFGIKINGNE